MFNKTVFVNIIHLNVTCRLLLLLFFKCICKSSQLIYLLNLNFFLKFGIELVQVCCVNIKNKLKQLLEFHRSSLVFLSTLMFPVGSCCYLDIDAHLVETGVYFPALSVYQQQVDLNILECVLTSTFLLFIVSIS